MGGAVELSLAFWEWGVLAGAEGALQDLINPHLWESSLGFPVKLFNWCLHPTIMKVVNSPLGTYNERAVLSK